MCGIAGIIDLGAQRPVDPTTLARMATAIVHRGPDESGYLLENGVGLANRRLSIVGLADGRQPIYNEDRSVAVVFNGELFDYPEKKAWLEGLGHKFRTHCDTEVIVHLYEEHGETVFEHLRGQFAIALFDRARRKILLARDRVGICPLFWARRQERLYFGSEIKAILSSGAVEPQPDERGLDHIFTFFAMATRRTAFKDISAILPGTYLRIDLPASGSSGNMREIRYWDLDFPDAGDEYMPSSDKKALDEFREIFDRAVEIRLRADVPVVGYLSGGVDSTSVVATASRIRNAPIPTFTIRIPKLDETDRALMAAKVIGSDPTIITCDSASITNAFPSLVQAAESPVMDTSCAALSCLAEEVHRQGYKVALTGEGADEALAGYPWFKVNRLIRLFDVGGFRPSNALRWAYLKLSAGKIPWQNVVRVQKAVGGAQAQLDLYGLVALSRSRFYSQKMWDAIDGHIAYDDLVLNLDRVRRWHRLNQSLYLGYKILLPGLLLNHKGDRPAMRSSVETRYPFLDEEFIAFCARLHPKYKLKGLTRDKHLLRLFASEILPPQIANRTKAMFRAPFADTFFDSPPPWVTQLLSEESLRKTGYFEPARVVECRANYHRQRWGTGARLTVEMGLTGVMAAQLWHHLFFGGGLCDLPAWTAPAARDVPVVT
ncbi:MAG TPA: asparagine synthase (glutamine-hydrolyzing) [Planctomycetia bacterium]|nr:asparagine synthase (glutamine-hydrolyzing) [Planctomycetia bacterium]